MNDLPDNKLQIAKDLVANLDPYKTIFYFDSKYHAVKNDWLQECPHDEAEALLKSPEYSLISLGDPPSDPPESCPAWICTRLSINIAAAEFLHILFGLHYQHCIINFTGKN
jgi:hypothetical protein